MKKSILTALICCIIGIQTSLAAGPYYTANNILVVIEGPTTSTTRDQALLQAQKTALAQFISVSDATQVERAKTISDSALSRTMKDFSLQNERVLSQSYQASFMIRFDPMKFEGLLRSYNMPLPPVKEIDLHNLRVEEAVAKDEPIAADGTTVPGTKPGDPTTTATPAAVAPVVILPVLNIGTRVIVWDEANAWRDAWLKKKALPTQSQFTVPLGDIDDLHDAPDTGFIKQTGKAQPGLDNMLQRYQAQALYIVWARAKQTPNGLTIKLYRYQDQKLEFKGEIDSSSRPGYLFDDGVTTTAGKIDLLQKGGSLQAATQPAKVVTAMPQVNPATVASIAAMPTQRSSMITTIIPVANMNAWISLQQQLRHVPGVTNLVTNSISANQAIVRIESNLPAPQLVESLQANGFSLQKADGGRFTLYKN